MTAIKPCPLCNSYKCTILAKMIWGRKLAYSVVCLGCLKEGDPAETKANAIKSWNEGAQ